jgi:hypothetical protein
MIHLKRQLILSIAELEMQKNLQFSREHEKPIVVLRMRKPIPPQHASVLELCSSER